MLDPGDIILIELHYAGPTSSEYQVDQAGYIAIEWWPQNFDAIRYAVRKGVIVVEAAGNGGENLDDLSTTLLQKDFHLVGKIRSTPPIQALGL
jgi:hypothetical protein